MSSTSSLRDHLRVLMAVLVTGWFLLPIAGLVLSTPGDGGGLTTLNSQPIPWRVIGESATIAVVVGGLATGIGLGFAVLLGLTDLRGGPVWMTLLMVPFACPATVWALAQTYAYGPGGVIESFVGSAYQTLFGLDRGHYLGVVLVLTQIHVPLTTLVIARGLGRLPNAGLEAARFFLRPAPLLVWMLRVIAVELGVAFLLASSLAFTNFAVPHVVRCRLYPVEIYLRLSNYLDQAGATWMALPMLSVSLIATGLVTWLLAPVKPLPSPRRPVIWHWGKWAWLGYAIPLLYLLCSEAVPVVSLVVECRSLGDWLVAAEAAATETWNSIKIGGFVSITACLAACVVVGLTANQSRLPAACGFALALGVPSLLVGLAFSRFYSHTKWFDLTVVGETVWLVVLGLSFRAWPYCLRVIGLGQEQIPSRWLEAARLSRMSSFARMKWLYGPLMAEHVLAAGVLAFAVAVGDVETTQMLCVPGEGTLALRLFTFLHFGPRQVAASLALLQIMLSVLPLAAYFAFFARCPRVF